MHDFRGIQNPWRCHWSDEIQKKGRFFFFGKSCSRDFGAPACHPSTLIDFVHTALASKISAETICMIWEGCRAHRAVTGPMNFKKSAFFFGKSCSRIFGAPGCHPSTLIDIANTALASKRSVKPICIISEGYRTHGGVTGPMKLKKKQDFFFGKSCSRKFGAPGCHPSTSIDLENTALASKGSVKTKCMITEGYRTHRGVTGPMKFKKKDVFFFRKVVLPGFWGPGCHPSTLIDNANTALNSKCSVKPICIISERYRTHGFVTSPMNFKKSGCFFPEFHAPVVLGHLAAIQAL